MKVWSLIIALVAVALAGCAGDAPAPVDEDEQKFDDIDVGDDEGAIRGIILDPSITPIEGATVTVKDQDLETRSNADGAFLFAGLAPGTYFLEVAKVGYTATQTSVSVEAGVDTPPIVKVQLTPDPSSVPFTQTFQYEGFMQCSFALVAVGFNACGFASDVTGQDFGEVLVRHQTAGVPDFAQTEMVWESTQPLGDALSLMYSWDCGDTFLCDHGTEGPSVLVLQADREVLETAIESEGDLFVRVFGTESSLAPGSNLGATIEQSFTHYTNAFYGFTPDEGWLFVEDGAHPVPS